MNTPLFDAPASLPLIRLDRIWAGFGGEPVFSNLSLSLYPGQHLALFGPNGSGKSTLLRVLQGDLRPMPGLPPENPGRIIYGFEGREDSAPLNARQYVRTVSPALQRNYVRQGWNISGEEILLSGLDNAPMVYGELSSKLYARAAALAEAAGASSLMSMQAPAMSQGQLRLSLILRALMSRPALLLLDEPFDGLDAPAREAVARVISLAAGQGSTLLVSAHRKEDIPEGIEKALLIRHGGLEKTAIALVEDRFTEGRSTADRPPLPPGEAGKPLCAEHTRGGRCGTRSGQAAACPLVEDILNLGPDSPPLFSLQDVDVFIERKQVLFGISWSVRKGERWVLSGRNGSGKSTLLRLLYGEEFASFGGLLLWCGKPRPGLDDLRQAVGYVSDKLQDGYDYDLSAEEVVVSGFRGHIGLYDEPQAGERALAREWLGRLGLERLAGSPFFSLSTGIMRRVLLARALASSPPVLLLDEPCSGLDASSRALFQRALEGLAANGVTLVYVSHRKEDLGPVFSHELRLENGRVVFCGAR